MKKEFICIVEQVIQLSRQCKSIHSKDVINPSGFWNASKHEKIYQRPPSSGPYLMTLGNATFGCPRQRDNWWDFPERYSVNNRTIWRSSSQPGRRQDTRPRLEVVPLRRNPTAEASGNIQALCRAHPQLHPCRHAATRSLQGKLQTYTPPSPAKSIMPLLQLDTRSTAVP